MAFSKWLKQKTTAIREGVPMASEPFGHIYENLRLLCS